MRFKIPCQLCHKKGLHYADHPHAFGWKNYDVVVCRFCQNKFLAKDIELKVKVEEENNESKLL